ncbi:hypothetical protein GGI18_004407, partial [Coemansia linderi]
PPMNPLITNPPKIAFISPSPDPAARGAYPLTKNAHSAAIAVPRATNANQRTNPDEPFTNTWSQVFQAAQDSVASSQQQNFWLSHHPVEHTPCLLSLSHSVTMEISAVFTPISIPTNSTTSQDTAES